MPPTTTLDSLETALVADAASASIESAGGRHNEACQNCAAVLQGPYCHRCGQHDEEIKRPLWSLAEHAMDSLFHFDSRVLRSYAWLLFRPGRMTRAYLSGQRAKFVPPIRLYIFTSLLFFLALSASGLVLVQPVSHRAADGDTTTNNIMLELLAPPSTTPVLLPDEIAHSDADVINVTRHGKQRTISVEKLVELANDPVHLSAFLTDWLPKVLVAAMPLFALLLGLLYVRRKRYLIDHLVLTLHLHALLFAVGLLLIGLRAATGHGLPAFALPSLLALYFLLTIKRVYAQNWARTIVKGFVLGLAYPIILMLSAIAFAIWT
ncbi:MAG: hypothetical protein JWM77_611 [Rhodospirillales bacterium]|nr:hypothetical protein [Rhodospirillales bacterium]